MDPPQVSDNFSEPPKILVLYQPTTILFLELSKVLSTFLNEYMVNKSFILKFLTVINGVNQIVTS